MRAIAVTGAAGSVGRRVVALLAADPAVVDVRAIDRAPMPPWPDVDRYRVDLAADPQRSDLASVLDRCDTVVHLADDPSRRSEPAAAVSLLEQVLDAAESTGCDHLVLLSSALVYGAHADNPIPITESQPVRPVTRSAYAVAKVRLENVARAWARRSGASLTILRPTTALSERGVSYVAAALRAATTVRPSHVEPPVQFLHHDDLASAVALMAVAPGQHRVLNVAPDGWIGAEVFRDLQAEAELRWPEAFDETVGRASRLLGPRTTDPGIAAYATHPWVVANDRLRAAGWEPSFSNEEAYVLGTPAPWWRTFALRRRQELALGAVGAATMGMVGAAGLVARRVMAPR